jgi:preprotein translocase subunit SecG
MILTAIFLVLVVLIQRGRGGGLAGAFGGMGGQSAFGTKAGDLFTRITIGVAAFWIILCIVTLKLTVNRGDQFDPNLGRDANTALPSSSGTDTGTGSGTGTTTPAAKDTSKDSGASTTPGAGDSKSSESPAATTPAEGGSKGAEKSDASK